MKSWEIEKMLKEDIREKKKTGSGAFHMRGKGVRHGFSGALRTPYHFMKTKEKKRLDGEVVTFNMFTTILNWNEFQLKDKETQKDLLTKWREVYPNTQIMETLAIGRERKFNSQTFADLVNGLGCPPKRTSIQPKTRTRKAKVKEEPFKFTAIETQPQKVELVLPPPTLEIEAREEYKIFNGLNLEYNGEYTAEDLAKIFTKLQLLVDGEENKFKLSLAMVEMG